MNAINEIKNKRVTRVLSKIKKENVYNRDRDRDIYQVYIFTFLNF